MLILNRLIFVALAAYSGHALAEHGCEDGFVPVYQSGQQVCVADYNLPYWNKSGGQLRSSPSKKWKTTWGAVALDSSVGIVSTSIGKFSKKEAGQEAIYKCSRDGGKDCRISMLYHNQCVVVAWPNVSGGNTVVRSGASIPKISAKALDECKKSSQGVSCNLFYSACSEPVLVTNN